MSEHFFSRISNRQNCVKNFFVVSTKTITFFLLVILFSMGGFWVVIACADEFNSPGPEIRNAPKGTPTLLIDIPGVNWTGEERGGDASHLLNLNTETIYVKHEGSKISWNKWDTSSYKNVVTISDSEKDIGKLLPLIQSAANNGRNIHIIIDKNITASRYATLGKPEEEKWAANVADFLLENTPKKYFKMQVMHSNGTLTPAYMKNVDKLDYAVIASPRTNKGLELVKIRPDMPIDIITGLSDIPTKPSLNSPQIREKFLKESPNLRVIELQNKDNRIATHSRLANFMYEGSWKIFEANNINKGEEFQGALGQILSPQVHFYGSIKSKPPIPSYWTYRMADQPQAKTMTESQIMTEMVHGRNRALIVGKGPEADLMYKNMVAKLGGTKNVNQIHTSLTSRQLQLEARKFGADVILGVKDHRRELNLKKPDLGRNYPKKTKRDDYDEEGVKLPDHFNRAGASYEGAEERVKEARKRSLEIDKARHPGAYGWPGKFGQPGAPTVLSNDIGGVMLQGVAKVSNATDTGLPLTGGMFSLIFQNGNAEIDIEKLRKFVTALWAVYFSEEGPGISIDPIAPGVDKHLVRYIGKVINSDLGRVMRETDYVMKKWAVGTEKPDVEGFKSVDDLTAQHGLRYLGASRRFWFVPEDMRFKKMSDALLFDSGKMTLKTEYVFLNKGARAEPADETFAKFFTDHYNEIAHKYPIYGELFEYAKLVSLARYLKERGVPMLWFLLVNKDMVITEDSPGTVDALAKKSDYCEYIKIEGGVDLAANPSSASYVMDQEAAQAIQRAIKLYGPNLSRGSSVVPSESITFEAGDEDLTLMPSQTLTLSRGTASGDKYQTDIAFHNGKEPGLELVRYYEPEYNGLVSFGKSWHLLIPYQVKPCGEEKINFLNAVIPKRMVIKNLLTGREANLTFSTDRYSIAGYVPEHLESSNVVGLFLLSDASYRLVDKIGNEFQFNQEGHLTDMILSEKYHVKFKYEYAEATRKDFNSSPYRIEPSGSEYEEIPNANIKLPKHLKIVDHNKGSEEIFVFNKNNRFNIMGYIPVDGEDSSYTILAFMTDGSFILADKEGKEISFSPSGKFDGIKTRVVKKISQGNYEVNFDYEFYKGQARIKQASAVRKDQTNLLCATKYEYASDGRLCKVLTPNGQEIEINYSKGKVMLASSEKN